eukprot:scaffold1102_cov256-Pinguiococcus_pyrenoidosus.AAC.18
MRRRQRCSWLARVRSTRFLVAATSTERLANTDNGTRPTEVGSVVLQQGQVLSKAAERDVPPSLQGICVQVREVFSSDLDPTDIGEAAEFQGQVLGGLVERNYDPIRGGSVKVDEKEAGEILSDVREGENLHFRRARLNFPRGGDVGKVGCLPRLHCRLCGLPVDQDGIDRPFRSIDLELVVSTRRLGAAGGTAKAPPSDVNEIVHEKPNSPSGPKRDTATEPLSASVSSAVCISVAVAAKGTKALFRM